MMVFQWNQKTKKNNKFKINKKSGFTAFFLLTFMYVLKYYKGRKKVTEIVEKLWIKIMKQTNWTLHWKTNF